MSAAIKSIAAVLNSLGIETCKDGQEGFRSAATDTQSRDFQSLFAEISIQRQQFAAELQRLVRDLGFEEMAETSGTLGGAFSRHWMDLKAALTSGDEHSILVECERNEDRAVEEYREALGHEELPANIRNVIQQQAMAVQATHDRVRDLRDRLEG